MRPTPKETQTRNLIPFSSQEAQDLNEIINNPQFAAAKRIRDTREAHLLRLRKDADALLDACDPELLLDRGGVYEDLGMYVDKCIEKQVKREGLSLAMTNITGTKRVLIANGASSTTKTTTPKNKHFSSVMRRPSSLRNPSRLNITTTMNFAKTQTQGNEPSFSRSSPEYDDPNFEYRISFPPLPSIISIGLDEEDFGPNTPSQYSNRTKGGTCYVDRFQDKPDTMFVYDSNHGGVFDLRSGSYVDEPVVPPGAKRQRHF